MAEDKRNKGIRQRMLALIIALLALFLFLFIRHRGAASAPGAATRTVPETAAGVPVEHGDSRQTATAADTGMADSTNTSGRVAAATHATHMKTGKKPAAVAASPDDSLRQAGRTADATGDSAHAVPDTAADTTAVTADPCASDTVAPWVYPDPSGGLHRGPVSVSFSANKPCRIEWKSADGNPWTLYAGRPLLVESTLVLTYRATDTCGRDMEVRQEAYDIAVRQPHPRCRPDMEYVSIGSTEFCIDVYEWPNRRKQRPTAYVSIYQAMDSCYAAGKRLCTTEEWRLACAGPYGWAYPYGSKYEPRACATRDTMALASGSRPECRGYLGIYDMSGNLLEWTNTRAAGDNRFYNVMGGFWESGSQSGCFDARYSYYPQNRHNPVGFRCCSDAAAAPGR